MLEINISNNDNNNNNKICHLCKDVINKMKRVHIIIVIIMMMNH